MNASTFNFVHMSCVYFGALIFGEGDRDWVASVTLARNYEPKLVLTFTFPFFSRYVGK